MSLAVRVLPQANTRRVSKPHDYLVEANVDDDGSTVGETDGDNVERRRRLNLAHSGAPAAEDEEACARRNVPEVHCAVMAADEDLVDVGGRVCQARGLAREVNALLHGLHHCSGCRAMLQRKSSWSMTLKSACNPLKLLNMDCVSSEAGVCRV
jgi:hypothetical protein